MQSDSDEVLGIVRCARCGHRLENEIECPFCSMFPEEKRPKAIPKWVYITACFMTSPLSIWFVIRSGRLTTMEKALCLSGCLIWFGVFYLVV